MTAGRFEKARNDLCLKKIRDEASYNKTETAKTKYAICEWIPYAMSCGKPTL